MCPSKTYLHIYQVKHMNRLNNYIASFATVNDENIVKPPFDKLTNNSLS